jgi:ketosteroid isomerase-like protein
MSQSISPEDDLRAIERLNQAEVRAVLANDVRSLMSLWSDDLVLLPPAGPIQRVRSSYDEMLRQGLEQSRALDFVECVFEFEEIQVLGDYAFEWGTYRWRARPRAGGDTMTIHGKIMRILRREPDGSWKMHRTINNTEPLQAAAPA